jgi:hypothetical protein
VLSSSFYCLLFREIVIYGKAGFFYESNCNISVVLL